MSGAIVTERPVRTAVLRNGWDDELLFVSFEACERSRLVLAHEREYPTTSAATIAAGRRSILSRPGVGD